MTTGESHGVRAPERGRKKEVSGTPALKHNSNGDRRLVPFGKYLLDQEIASGGMARVFLARLRGLGGFEKKLVVKQVRPELANDPRFLSLFVQEANTLVQMSHPHIVPVYELGVVDGIYFLAMEYVEGATLAELLQFQKPFPPSLAFYVGECVAEALAYAHNQFGLVHRDVTPNNIMVDRVGHVRLLDFGIAAPAHGAESGDVFGSIGYMSPEQARGESVSAASDLFALGTVLFEALTGGNPWQRENRQSSLNLLLAADGTPLPIGPGPTWVPEHLRRMVESLVHRDESRRPQSASTVATALRSWLASEHPEGVGQALADLVERVVDARQRGPGRGSKPPPATSETSQLGQTQSLATSATLATLLDRSQGKEAPLPSSEAAADNGVRTAPVTGRFLRQEPSTARPFPRKWMILMGIGAVGALMLVPLLTSTPPLRQSSGGFLAAKGTGLEDKAAAEQAPAPVKPAGETQRTSPSQPQTPPEKSTPVAQGSITVSARPWAQLSIDQRVLGETSRQRVQVSTGNHTVTLRCPPFGTSVRIPVEVGPRENAVIIADMTTNPPTIRRSR